MPSVGVQPTRGLSDPKQLDALISEDRDDLELTAERFDVAAQRFNRVVLAAFETRERGLRRFRDLCELDPRLASFFAELAQRERAALLWLPCERLGARHGR